MGYQSALEAAGAEILEFAEFGSYQGDWLAKVKYNGIEGFVKGSYGSCSGCDAFQAEFGWYDEEKSDYQERLASFGAEYLTDIRDKQDLLEYFREQATWDYDAEKIIQWLNNN